MASSKFSISKRLKSFVYAFNGLRILLTEEHNSRIHLLAAIAAVILGCVLQINYTEWLSVLFCIGMVISLELVNSAIENLADCVSPEKNERIKTVKDMAAGAVLWGAIIAFVIGTIIFLPKILNLITQ
ncbi:MULTISPECIES: diacylglycerol kinase family protein [unclassified Saccharicrinis]|uniref:diacylglycerol kinase family protein n=1 Tax=unclassified Saccharicrinis TaxID=2646859 RepID=UPI003D344177